MDGAGIEPGAVSYDDYDHYDLAAHLRGDLPHADSDRHDDVATVISGIWKQ